MVVNCNQPSSNWFSPTYQIVMQGMLDGSMRSYVDSRTFAIERLSKLVLIIHYETDNLQQL